MARVQRHPDEVEKVKESILTKALEIIKQEGYEQLSMRKLGQEIGIAAKTIYNYFKNQDELYLLLLTKGFEQLNSEYKEALKGKESTLEKSIAFIETHINFGFENRELYNLMFSWKVPKSKDYLGTDLEAAGQKKLKATKYGHELSLDLMAEYLGEKSDNFEQELKLEMVYVWAPLHGYVSGVINADLGDVYEGVSELKNEITMRIIENMRTALDKLACK